MEPDIEVTVNTEAVPDVTETANDVIEAAVVIADKIDEARQEGAAEAGEVQAIKYGVDDVYSLVIVLTERVGVLTDLVMGLSDQIAALTVLEVAEAIEDHTPAEVEAIVETAEEIAPVIEEPVIAVEPEIRKSTKRQWI